MATGTLQKNIPKGWGKKKIKDLLVFERPDNYIVKNSVHKNRGATPVLTANKSFILGYTDEDFGIYKNTPAIIFDDFTTDSKYVDFPFKIKSSAIKILKNKDGDADIKYVYEVMKSIQFPIANHKRHYISQYQDQEIVVPSISEQKKIAEILANVDQEILNIEETILKTGELKSGLMSELFSKGIGHKKFKKTEIGFLPEEWDVILLDSVSKRGSGHTPNKQHPEYWNGGIKWVSLSDSKKLDNRYIYETDKEISLEGIKKSSAVLHAKDTVIICRDAGIGKVAILGTDNMAVSQHFISWKCAERLNHLYLYYLLQSWKSKFERIATGTTIKTIGLSFFKELLVPLAGIEEQEKIVNILWSVDEKIKILRELKAKLSELKKGLMSDLLSGSVRVK